MLERLLPFLDIVVLEQKENGTFQIFAPFPSWFLEFYPEAGEADVRLKVGEKFPFLNDFLSRATDFWKRGSEGSLPSGGWVETNLSGKERMLQAFAISVSGRSILLIEPARIPLEEAQLLIQKGRQTNLNLRTVKRKQKSLRKTQQRYEALLETVPDWVFVIHQDGSILEYSAGREALFENFELESEKKVNDLFPGDLAPQFMSNLEIVISTGRPKIWKHDANLEILMLASGPDEALCVFRKK
jgi:PAS domain-containing protein